MDVIVLIAKRVSAGSNWLGLAITRELQDDDNWFCSELVQHVKNEGGLYDLRYGKWRVTPRDLWNLPYQVEFAAGVAP